MSREGMRQGPAVLVGAKALARYIFDNEKRWRSVYALRRQFRLFRVQGMIAGSSNTIDRIVAELEEAASAELEKAASADPAPRRPRGRPRKDASAVEAAPEAVTKSITDAAVTP